MRHGCRNGTRDNERRIFGRETFPRGGGERTQDFDDDGEPEIVRFDADGNASLASIAFSGLEGD